MDGETRFQSRLDLGLGLSFLAVSFFAGYRTYKSWTSMSGGRKVISVFNTLLFLASFTRAVWFLIPNDCLEPSYEPLPKKFQEYRNEGGLLTSEILLSLGSFFLYGVFILIACYWYTMLRKLETDKSFSEHGVGSLSTAEATAILSPSSRESGKAFGTLELFFPILAVMMLVSSANIIFFIWGWFDTETMVSFDALSFALFASVVLGCVMYLSHKINRVLRNMEAINQSSSQAQIRRIEAIVFLAKFFFATRILIELGMCWWMLDFPHVFGGQGRINDEFWWNSYIIAKHAVEVLVLTLELLISSAIRSYDNRRVTQRYTPLTNSTDGPSMLGAGIVYSSSSGVGIEMHDQPFGSSRRVSYGAVTDNESSIVRPSYPQQKLGRSSIGAVNTNGDNSLKTGYNYQSIPTVPIEGRIEGGTIRYISNSGSGSSGAPLSTSVTRGKAYSGVLSVSLNSTGPVLPTASSTAASISSSNAFVPFPDEGDDLSDDSHSRPSLHLHPRGQNYNPADKKKRLQEV